jgi:hypothetical protein
MKVSGNRRRSASVGANVREKSRTARRLVALGAGAAALGLAVAGTAPVLGTAPDSRVQSQQELGGVLLLLGWLALVIGIHRLGRASSSPSDDALE